MGLSFVTETDETLLTFESHHDIANRTSTDMRLEALGIYPNASG